MDKIKSFYPHKFAAKIETTDMIGSIHDIVIRGGSCGNQFIMKELTIMLEAKIMAATESSKKIKVKLPAPSFIDFVLSRQKTVSVTIDAYEVMPNLSDPVNFRIFDFNQSYMLDAPRSEYLSKWQILAFLRCCKIKLKRK